MKSGSKPLDYLLILFFVASSLHAQVNAGFIKYLSTQHFQREHFAYLQSLSHSSIPDDSINYWMAKYYLQYFDDSLFYDYYSKSGQLITWDTCAFTLAHVYYLKEKSPLHELWFNSHLAGGVNSAAMAMQHVYRAGMNPVDFDVSLLPEELRGDFVNYRKYYQRKPVVAGALSALIPGLGKYYAGRKYSSIMVFFAHLTYGLQSYESIKKLGISHPFSIFSIGLFSLFYVSNIYGSYFDLKQVKKENRNQFLINASDYFNINCACELY